ncbi:hypothetical protein HOV12_gp51 [Streptomyces phage Lilbooboo]|uniref:Uncharacterized protein n=1 Tax=Streptomyces phage Lilbooboo TaxID=2510571 RepID=A0A411B372_9CAUD|nr:hypothetical protein HOV12_gp51 [Streptomyces phage Lilbooboo]QAX94741.1 hypothetical protein SEA_LILBOOBOO_42 [Streptomyces phage Lilbooboo]
MSDEKPNPFLELDPAAIDVIDDMVDEWLDRERHGELNGGWGYGPKKSAALDRISTQIKEAWRAKVRYADAEEIE